VKGSVSSHPTEMNLNDGQCFSLIDREKHQKRTWCGLDIDSGAQGEPSPLAADGDGGESAPVVTSPSVSGSPSLPGLLSRRAERGGGG